MIQKCIYCGIDRDLSESDIIPDALTNARILNRNVCKIEHNNKFSDMFESKVIDALSFITNELDIKSSKGKKYAPYEAVISINGMDYDLKLHGDNEIFNGRVLKSVDNTQMISSYDRVVKIVKDKNKVQPLDINTIEIEKKIRINNEIFFDKSMYRMLSKIAFEWYCSKNSISGYYSEFKDIIKFITTGNGRNPVSIIQEEELYKMLDQQVNLGSHTLFAFEKEDGEIDVVISLFGLLMYRVKVTNNKPTICENNFLYTELRTDSSRNELVYHSYAEAKQKFDERFDPENFKSAGVINGVTISIPKEMRLIPNVGLYLNSLNLIKYLTTVDTDTIEPNEKVNEIFLNRLRNITQTSTLQKKSIKRFVSETFYQNHEKIRLNFCTSDKKAVVLFYAVYLIGKSKEESLDDRILQRILKEGFPCLKGESFIVNDKIERELKQIMMADANYSDVLEVGAEKVMHWQN